MFKTIGRLAAVHSWKVCATWLAVSIALGFLMASQPRRSPGPDIQYLPKQCDSVQGYRLLESAFPQSLPSSTASVDAERGKLEHVAIALVVVAFLAVLVFQRSPGMAAVGVMTGGVSAWISLTALELATQVPGVSFNQTTRVLALVFPFTVAVSACLFVFRRYRDELANGHATRKALKRTIAGVGRALVYSACGLGCGLATLGLAGFGRITYAGPMLACSVLVALSASLILAPAILRLLGRRVLWPERWTDTAWSLRWQDRWDGICDFVITRPVLALVAAIIIIAPLALVRLSTSSTPAPLPGSTASPQGKATVLLSSKIDWDTPQGRAVVERLSLGFSYLKGVAEVQSLTRPLGSAQRGAEEATSSYVATLPCDHADSPEQLHVTRLEVLFRSPPLTPESIVTQKVIQTWLRDELTDSVIPLTDVAAACYGTTAENLDLIRVIQEDSIRVMLFAFLAIGSVLLLAVRRLWLVALVLVVSLVTCYATLGGMALLSKVLPSVLGNGLDWQVFFVLYPALLAAATAQSIRPLLRIFRPGRSTIDENEMWDVLNRSGGPIVCGGLLTAGLGGALMFGGPIALVQIGLGLTLGTLINTIIIRPLLIPSCLLLASRAMQKLNMAEGGDRIEDTVDRRRVA